MKKSFVLHRDSLVVLDELTDEQAGKLFKAIRSYHEGDVIDLDFAMKMAFLPFKNQFERDQETYQKIVERNRSNGRKGGAPTKPKTTQKTQSVIQEPKKADSDSDSVNDSDNEKEDKSTSTKVEGFDWDSLRLLINKTFGREFKTINKDVRKKYNARLKDGYTKKDVLNAINNCKNDKFHIDLNFHHCTPEYFSRSNTLDLHSTTKATNKPYNAHS